MGVVGPVGKRVVVPATEIFEPEHSHDTPEDPLKTTVFSLDPPSGAERWSVSVRGLAALAVGSDAVYVAAGRTISAHGRDGGRRWTRELSERIRAATVLGDTLVCVLGRDPEASTLVGLSADGDTRWRVSQSTRWLVPHGDRVYAGDESVAAVTADGSVAWRRQAHGHDPLFDPDTGRVYTRTNARMNAVDAYDLPGGERPFRFVTPSNNGWPLAATADTLVAEAITPDAAEFTSLFAVDASTGAPRAVYRPSDTVFTATGFEGTVYAGFGGGRLGVFDARP